MPRSKIKSLASGGISEVAPTSTEPAAPANAALNYGTVPDYVFVPGGYETNEKGKRVYRSGRYELRTPEKAAPTASSPISQLGGTSTDGSHERSSDNPGWDAKTDAEKAAYYSANPAMAAITQAGQKAFGFTSLGALSKALDPNGWDRHVSIANGVDPAGQRQATVDAAVQNNEDFNYNGGSAQAAQAAQAAADAAFDRDWSAGMQGIDGGVSGGAPSGASTGVSAEAAANGPGDGTAADYAKGGGITALAKGGTSLGSYSDGGNLLKGPGTGLSDHIPAKIGARQPARLADGEFVISADVVSALGGGSTDSGARKLYAMMDRIRKQAHGTKKQVKPVNDKKVLPA
jgi:hypothetical protein